MNEMTSKPPSFSPRMLATSCPPTPYQHPYPAKPPTLQYDFNRDSIKTLAHPTPALWPAIIADHVVGMVEKDLLFRFPSRGRTRPAASFSARSIHPRGDKKSYDEALWEATSLSGSSAAEIERGTGVCEEIGYLLDDFWMC